ncbi:MAG: hypothetical protein PWQ63_223 [Methanolobus sp.]|nr:hypothetical protein [Methanolobus sp.]MDK2947063.1 hypothetical protein [Methanolobus sp.]
MQLICQRTINNDFGKKIRGGDIIEASNKDSIVDKKNARIKNNMIDFIKPMFSVTLKKNQIILNKSYKSDNICSN